MGIVTINKRELGGYGVTLLDGSYSSLLTPAELKDWVFNDDPGKNGIEYMPPTTPVVKERAVNLIFLIQGSTRERFLSNYNVFISLLQQGLNTFYFEDLGRAYTLKYESCTDFDHFNLTSCKIAVKFIEPDPTKTTKTL